MYLKMILFRNKIWDSVEAEVDAAVAEDEAVEAAAEVSKDTKIRALQSLSSNLEQFHTPARYSSEIFSALINC